MSINEDSILAVMNPLYLLLGGGAVCLLGYFCARRYKNTNDFAKSVKLYLPCVLVLDILLAALFGVHLALIAGLDVCGFAAMALISNHYFYH